jgi:chorismate-pyruvate lyase
MPGLSDVGRILLVSDDTFTYQLEAFVREPIGVEILSNEPGPLSAGNAELLLCPEGGQVWDRRTLLRGKKTRTAYCYATSIINDQGLDSGFREELRATQSGIGHLMAKYRMGTFRELLTYRARTTRAICPTSGTPPFCRGPTDHTFVSKALQET